MSSGDPTLGDMRCCECGYNLHGLDENRQCPECGTDIRRTVYGNALLASDMGWIKRLGRGVFLIRLWIYCALYASLSAFDPGPGDPDIGIDLVVVSTIGGVLGIAGFLLFTSPDPGGPRVYVGPRARSVARTLMVPACIAMTTADVAIWYEETIGSIGVLAARVLVLAGLFALNPHAVSIAQRTRDERLASRTQSVIGQITILYVIATAGRATAVLGLGVSYPSIGHLLEIGWCFSGLAFLAVAVEASRLSSAIQRRLKAARKELSGGPGVKPSA